MLNDTSRRQRISLLSLLAALGIACAHDSTSVAARPPSRPAASIQIDGAIEILQGQTATLHASVRDASGGLVSDTVTWSSGSSSVATVDQSGVVRGVNAGVTAITASAGAVTSTHDLVVDAASASISFTHLPDSATIALHGGTPDSDFVVTLPPNDTFDLMLTHNPSVVPPFHGVHAVVETPGFALSNTVSVGNGLDGVIYPGLVVPPSGRIRFAVVSMDGRSSTGMEIVRIRKSGPIVEALQHVPSLVFIAQGGTRSDTVWMNDPGVQGATVSARSSDPALTVTPGAAAVPPFSSPLNPATGSPAPAKLSIPFVTHLDARGLPFSGARMTIQFGGADPLWRGAFPDSIVYRIAIYDSSAKILPQLGVPGRIRRGPNGAFVFANDILHAVDTVTGRATTTKTYVDTLLLNARFTASGVMYAVLSSVGESTYAVVRVNADGSTRVVGRVADGRGAGGDVGFVLLPDESAYLTHANGVLTRFTSAGAENVAQTHAAFGAALTDRGNLVFNPADSALYYFGADRVLWRFDLKTRSEQIVGSALEGTGPFNLIDADSNGRMYAIVSATPAAYIAVLDRTGKVVDRIHPPTSIVDFAVFGASIIGVGFAGEVWKIPQR